MRTQANATLNFHKAPQISRSSRDHWQNNFLESGPRSQVTVMTPGSLRICSSGLPLQIDFTLLSKLSYLSLDKKTKNRRDDEDGDEDDELDDEDVDERQQSSSHPSNFP